MDQSLVSIWELHTHAWVFSRMAVSRSFQTSWETESHPLGLHSQMKKDLSASLQRTKPLRTQRDLSMLSNVSLDVSSTTRKFSVISSSCPTRSSLRPENHTSKSRCQVSVRSSYHQRK